MIKKQYWNKIKILIILKLNFIILSTHNYFVIMAMLMAMGIGIGLNVTINPKVGILMIMQYRDKTIMLPTLTHAIQTNNNPK